MDQIHELLNRVVDQCRLQVAIVKELEDQRRRIRALEENRKQKDLAITNLTKQVQNLTLMQRKNV